MTDDLSDTAIVEAIEALQALERMEPSVAAEAKRLRVFLMTFDETGSSPFPPLQAFAEAVEKSPRRRKPPAGAKFATPIFKCLSDHEICLKKYGSPLCSALAALCIARHLIPFVGK